MNQNQLAWRPLNTKELILGLVLFGVPILSDLVKLIFGYDIGNPAGQILLLATIVFILTILIFGLLQE